MCVCVHLYGCQVTGEYKSALATHGFTAFAGDDARIQPGNLQEAMLHETAVAWVRTRLHRTLPKRPWEEDDDTYAKRLKAAGPLTNTPQARAWPLQPTLFLESINHGAG